MTAQAKAQTGSVFEPDPRVEAAIELAERLGLDTPWETNGQGQLIVNPPVGLEHAKRVERIAAEIRAALPGWRIWPEVGLHTRDGLKAPDLAVASPAFEERTDARGFLTAAPELCVQVMSSSNSWAEMMEKARLYRAAGAVEIWICDLQGRVHIHTGDGGSQRSALVPAMPDALD